VAVLPYLEERGLYEQFHLDEPWDGPHNRLLLDRMPKVFAAPGSPETRRTPYQVFVGPGAVFDPGLPRTVSLHNVPDGAAGTLLLAEAAEPVEWTRPADLTFGPGPLPRLGGVVSEGFGAAFCNGDVRFIKKEVADNDKVLRALIGCRDGEVVNLDRYELERTRTPAREAPPPPPADEERRALAMEMVRFTGSQNNLRQMHHGLQRYHDTHRRLPLAAVCGKDGTPLLSWRVALLPYLDQRPLYDKFHLDEPWDGPHNKPLLELMPKVFAVPGVSPPEPYSTWYRVFVGPGAPFDLNPATAVTLGAISAEDGTGNTLAVVEAGEAVPWTKPDELTFAPDRPLPRLGGPFPDGFNAVTFDGSVTFFRKDLQDDAAALRALAGWKDGEVVDRRRYEEDRTALFRERMLKLSPENTTQLTATIVLGRMAQSKNNLKQLALALHNYDASNNRLPAAAVFGKDGTPLLSWRVALLPYLGEGPLYKQFHLDEPWDSEHNKDLLRYLPKVFAAPGLPWKEPGETYYRVFVGPGSAFPPGPKARVSLSGIKDDRSRTVLVAEAGEGVPWTKPDELAFEAKGPLPKLGGVFADGFHAACADGTVRFLKKGIYADEAVLRALVGIDDGVAVDLSPYE
jgi:hypothetical protein